jgi:hypothetical protein
MGELIKINDTFSIERNGHNWTVHKFSTSISKKGKNKGEEVVNSTQYYFGKLEQALLDIINERSEDMTCAEMLHIEIVGAKRDILNAVEDIKANLNLGFL